MKNSLIALAAATAALFTVQVAVAQEAAPKTRAEVKAEAKEANKAGTIEKGAAVAAPVKASSNKARADVKKEAAAANKSGTIEKGAAVAAPTKAPSDKTRAEVKSEAADANKSGEAKNMNTASPIVAPKK